MVFVWVGGCDYCCVWCDMFYVVDMEYCYIWVKMIFVDVMVEIECFLGGVFLMVSLLGGNLVI